MTRRTGFAVLAVIGAVVPYSAFSVFLYRSGLDLGGLVRQAFGSPGATFFALDVIVSAIAVIYGALTDRHLTHWPWAPVVASVVVGPSCGLPLWQALRTPDVVPTDEGPSGRMPT